MPEVSSTQTGNSTIVGKVEDDDVVAVKNLSKKFCKNLRRSMGYGIADLTKNLVGIKTDSTQLRRDEFWAVDDINFELRKGEVLGLIGVNGSGKTTLLRLLSGIFPPDKGEIMIKGRVGALIALGAGFHPHMTGRENVYLNGAILGLKREEIDAQFGKIIEFSEIGSFINAPVATYSSGMRVRLGFSVAMAMNPDVLLIDEVLAVGDMSFRIKCLNAINDLMQNAAVIFVTHSMQYVSYICTKIMVLNKGSIDYYSNEVKEGIDHYLSHFKRIEKRVSGSGRAAVSNVRIYSDNKSTTEDKMLLLDFGDDLLMEMTVSVDSSVNQPVIKVFIFNQTMQPIADCCSEQCGFEIKPEQSKRRIRLKLRNIQFHSGVYSVGIAVSDLSNREILFRGDYVAFFQVKNVSNSWASVLLPGEWEEEYFEIKE